jgi:universal stress protein E
MRRFRSIIVGVRDPAGPKTAAMDKGAQIARGLGATLELFHDLTDTLLSEAMSDRGVEARDVQKEMRAARLKQLEKHAERLRATGVEVSCAAEWDYPAFEAIIRRAVAIAADLIVIERHRFHHPASWLLKYTDWELVRLSPVPVLLTGGARYDSPKILAAIDPVHAYAKPSDLDDEILAAGRILADALGGKLELVHAYSTPMPPIPAYTGPLLNPSTAREETVEQARARAGKIAKRYGLSSRARHFVSGHPIDVVPQVARAQRSAIVAMGAVSRSGLKRLFIGNTAEQIIDRIEADLLIVKPKSFAAKIPRTKRGARVLSVPITPY